MEKIGDIVNNYLAERVDMKFSSINLDMVREMDLSLASPKLKFDAQHPIDYVGDMMESKEFVKRCRAVPNRYKKPLVSNMKVQLASCRMELYNTEKLLSTNRKKMDLKRRGLIQQWIDLEEKENQLRLNFIRFNQFVKENHEKKARAELKLVDERKLAAKRQTDIDEIKKTINQSNKTLKKMDKKIGKYKPFTEFLRQVLEIHPEFNTIHDIMERYNELATAKEWLSVDQSAQMSRLEHAQNNMMKLIEEKNFVIMGLNNQIANLQARYENANIKALESEELVTQIKNNAVKQLSEIDIVKTSIWNVYVHMASSKKHPVKIKRDNVEEQIMYINRTLTELSKVNKLIKKKSIKK